MVLEKSVYKVTAKTTNVRSKIHVNMDEPATNSSTSAKAIHVQVSNAPTARRFVEKVSVSHLLTVHSIRIAREHRSV